MCISKTTSAAGYETPNQQTSAINPHDRTCVADWGLTPLPPDQIANLIPGQINCCLNYAIPETGSMEISARLHGLIINRVEPLRELTVEPGFIPVPLPAYALTAHQR